MKIKSPTTPAIATAMLLGDGVNAAKEASSFYNKPEGLFPIRPDKGPWIVD